MSNVQPRKVRIMWVNEFAFLFIFSFSFLFFFGGVHATVITEPAVTRDLFDTQTPAGACWKGNYYRIHALCQNSDR